MSTESKHTPTWTVKRYGDGDSLVIHSDSLTRVCFMATPGSLGDILKIEANAALIVRAVNERAGLIEALQEAHDILALGCVPGWGRAKNVINEALARAKATP